MRSNVRIEVLVTLSKSACGLALQYWTSSVTGFGDTQEEMAYLRSGRHEW